MLSIESGSFETGYGSCKWLGIVCMPTTLGHMKHENFGDLCDKVHNLSPENLVSFSCYSDNEQRQR